ncbi:MAG: DUF2065 domain-containing protein [Marinosulfonomonas sp.]|nr:MAG: DUF2065 domain-containing protein [Marinosulfonomonas sp.]
MATILLALGLVLVIEGLVYALAPSLVERLLEALQEMSLEVRRRFGLGAVALGVGLVWLAQIIG